MTYNFTLKEFEINGPRADISYFAMLFEQTHYRFLRDEHDGEKPLPKYPKETSFHEYNKIENTTEAQSPPPSNTL